MIRERLHIYLAYIQGVYFTVFGIWPIVSIRTFQAVSGEKTDHLVTGLEADHWLVNTVGLLITVIGIALLVSAWRRSIAPEIALLAALSALALATIDVVYVSRGVILPIYLADAAVEISFTVAWPLSYLCRD